MRHQSLMAILSKDERKVYSVGSRIAIYTLQKGRFTRIARFEELRNPAWIALSRDERLLAGINTSGRIMVFDTQTGSILLQSAGTKCESHNLYFFDEDRQLICKDWDGRIFTLDLQTGKFSVFPQKTAMGAFLDTETSGRFISFSEYELSEENRRLIIEEVDSAAATVTEVFTIDGIAGTLAEMTRAGGHIYFFIDYFDGSSDVSVYDIQKRTLKRLLKLKGFCPQEFGRKNMGYSVKICPSPDEKYLVIGYSSWSLIYDTEKQSVVNLIEIPYFSYVKFMKEPGKVLIGTWEKMVITDFEHLLKSPALEDPQRGRKR